MMLVKNTINKFKNDGLLVEKPMALNLRGRELHFYTYTRRYTERIIQTDQSLVIQIVTLLNYQISVIISFLLLILTLNHFIFNDKHFLQTSGVSMGTNSYAKLFMGKFEKTHFTTLPTFIYVIYVFSSFGTGQKMK